MISKRDMNPFFQKGGFIMSNKKSKLGVISAIAAGTGTAIYLAQKAKKESGNSESGNSIFKKSTVADSSVPDNYRNTERGKYDRNSKGIYYSNGNYEAFAHPEKPEGVDQKNAYIVGSGLASLAAACFLKILLVDRLLMGNESISLLVNGVVCLTLCVTVILAKFVGCTLPLFAKRLCFDPALMSSPFITTIVDALSLLVYFLFAKLLLGV